MISRRQLLNALSIGTAASVAAPWARAQTTNADWPTRPIRLIVGSGAGGGPDIFSRKMVESIAPRLGQPIVVDNKAGGNGVLGMQALLQAPADGYSFLYGFSAGFALSPHIVPNFPVNVRQEFAPVAKLVESPGTFVVRSSLGVSNLKELMALAKRQKLSFASAGNGSMSHLNITMLSHLGGVDLLHVPYKTAPAPLLDLAAGRVDMYVSDYVVTSQLIQRGDLRALAITGTKRMPYLPDVPTFAEQGFPFTNIGWGGIFARRGTPEPIIERMSNELREYVQSAAGRDFILNTIGANPTWAGPKEFGATIEKDYTMWGDLIRKAGIKSDG